MALKKHITTEPLQGLFPNAFKLTNYAIELAKTRIHYGDEVNADALLEEIIKNPHKDLIAETEELAALEEEEEPTYFEAKSSDDDEDDDEEADEE